MKTLYPPIEPYDHGMLGVSGLHTLYYEQCGNPDGRAALFLHGGPGFGLAESFRSFFNPEMWRIVLFDQRGSGQSTPHSCLEENTTWHLVEDIETLRKHLGIERWLVFGGSWGSTLALAYAQMHPDRVSQLVLRGIFLCRRKEIEWFYQQGASAIFPDAWEDYVRVIPVGERNDLLGAFYRPLTGPHEAVRLEAGPAWRVWEGSTSMLRPDKALIEHMGDALQALAVARIECHYFTNNTFFESDNYLLERVGLIRHIPATIVQGRYDVVCPMMSAWDLHRAWPEADFRVVPDAGHSSMEPGIVAELVDATDRYAG